MHAKLRSRPPNRLQFLRFATLPLAFALSIAASPAVSADEPALATGTFTITFTPVSERMADGNTFIHYTFTEHLLGDFDGTVVGSGAAPGAVVIHPNGYFNTANTGIFTGTIEGRAGTAVLQFRGRGTFASAGGSFTLGMGTGGLAGVHAEGTDTGYATGPTTFVGVYSFKVHFSA